MRRDDSAEIMEKLSARAEGVARWLLPAGRKVGSEWQASGSKSPIGCAIAVVITGRKQGVVLITGTSTVASAKGGVSLLGLIKEVKGCTWAEAYGHARRFLGLEEGREETPEERTQRESKEAQAKEAREAVEKVQRDDSIAAARAIWRECQDGPGTLAEAYFASRGLDVARIDWTDIRFHPALHHEFDGRRWPAVVARVREVGGLGCAVWRIYLRRDGQGKAPLGELAKLGKGPAGGGAVRLGGSGRHTGFCEGLETGLAIRELTRCALPVWVCLSTSGMIGVEFAPELEVGRIFPDGDKPRSFGGGEARPVALPPGQRVVLPPGRAAAARLKDRLQESGRRFVMEAEPPPTLDYLDVLQRMKKNLETA